MKVRKWNSVVVIGIAALTGGLFTQLTAQAPQDPATTPPAVEPPTFLDYQAGLREALWKDKPLFVIFRCER